MRRASPAGKRSRLAYLCHAGWHGLSIAAFAFLLFRQPAVAREAEFRAFWASAYQDGFKTPAQVSRMIAEVRAANCNAILVEVRKRGDLYCNSKLEAKADDVAPDFDPLADILQKAHDTNNGPRIEIHAWVVAYPVWGEQYHLPEQPRHPYRSHPDWLTEDLHGERWYAEYYSFDPGHPAVQEYLFNICMDLVSRYDIDGLQLDHIRYDRNTWGYNPTTVGRFNRRFHRAGQPAPTDPDWLQFRRDQVTELVRKIYLCAIDRKPQIKISVAANTRAPGISQTADWPKAAPYSTLLQDWRSWMEEGIIDMAIDLAYFRQQQWASAFDKWITFAKDNRYHRHAIYSSGPFINSVQDSLYQIHATRKPSALGNRVDGVALYCYSITSNDGVSREDFLKALTRQSPYDPAPAPVFAKPVPVPDMPWKTKPQNGALKGFVREAAARKVLEQATLTLTGPDKKEMRTDVTGFYGAVELPPGAYQLIASSPGLSSATNPVTIKAGAVATSDLVLSQK